jgi:hydrogenase nickel incorporation protein HypA/HybF
LTFRCARETLDLTGNKGARRRLSMHEYGIAQALVSQVGDIARQHDASTVRHVVVQVGKLRAVVPEVLQWGFEVAAAGSVAAGAQLEIEEIDIRIRCRACGTEHILPDPFFVCPDCGSLDVEQVAGAELILKSLEIEDDRDPRPSEHSSGE